MPSKQLKEKAGKKGHAVLDDSDMKVEATYGGVVLAHNEACDIGMCFGLRRQLPSFPFRKGNDVNGRRGVVDGSSLWSGDGKFFNHSCCPQLVTKGSITFFSEPNNENVLIATKKERTATRGDDLKIICFYARYVTLHAKSDKQITGNSNPWNGSYYFL